MRCLTESQRRSPATLRNFQASTKQHQLEHLNQANTGPRFKQDGTGSFSVSTSQEGSRDLFTITANSWEFDVGAHIMLIPTGEAVTSCDISS